MEYKGFSIKLEKSIERGWYWAVYKDGQIIADNAHHRSGQDRIENAIDRAKFAAIMSCDEA